MRAIKLRLNLADILFVLSAVFVLALPALTTLKALLIIVFFTYMMMMKVIHRRRIKNTLHLVGAFLFLGFAYISRSWALFPEAVDEQINNVLWTVLLSTAISTYVLYNNLTVKDVVKRLIPVAIVLLLNVIFNATFDGNRLSMGINENIFGRLTGGIACFFLYQCKRERFKSVAFDILGLLISMFTLLSGSRSSVLLLAVYVLAFFFFEYSTKNVVKNASRILAIVGAIVVGYMIIVNVDFLYQSIGHRMESFINAFFGDAEGDGSMVTRENMMQMAREIFLQNPLRGIGLNNFKFATYHGTYAHNNYYELAACTGVLGLVIYYTPYVIYAVRSIKGWLANRAEAIMPVSVMLAFFLGDLGGVSYFNMIYHVFVGLAIGLLVKQSREPAVER